VAEAGGRPIAAAAAAAAEMADARTVSHNRLGGGGNATIWRLLVDILPFSSATALGNVAGDVLSRTSMKLTWGLSFEGSL
jgi:hypothetical protein